MSAINQLSFSHTRFSLSSIPLSLWAFSLLMIVAHTTLGSQIVFGDARVNFMLILTLLWAFSYGSRAGVCVGFLAGLIYDLGSSTNFGVMMLCLSLLGFFAGMRQIMLFKEDIRLALIGGVLASAVLEALFGIVLIATGFKASLLSFVLYKFLPSTFLDLVFCVICFFAYTFFLGRQESSASYKGVRYRS